MKFALKNSKGAASAALICLAAAGNALADMTPDQVARIGKDLTPVGAERAGNKDGSIPQWEGGLTAAPAGFDRAKGYLNPYAADKVLYTITAANVEQHKDKLSAGQIEMLKRFPTFKMDVYPSRRSAAYPASIYELAKSEGAQTRLADGGNGVVKMEKGTVPFPIPKNGLEVQWNHQARYFGGTWTRYNAEFPVQTNGAFTPTTRDETFAAPWALDKTDPNRLYYYLAKLTGPSNVAGDGVLVHEPQDQVKEPRLAWIYNPGTRRVLRAPQFAYDAPGSGADGLRTIDDHLAFNGAPDRFDWKLIGKKEMIISYNNFTLSDKSLKYKDIIQPSHIKSDLVRYEKHRVWVVEATVKKGMRHIYAKRVFYVDEDSWSIAHIDQYDGRGELWRVRDVHLMPYYDQPMTWGIAEVLYDLQARRYLVTGMMNEEKPMRFGDKLTLKSFAPEAMRRLGN